MSEVIAQHYLSKPIDIAKFDLLSSVKSDTIFQDLNKLFDYDWTFEHSCGTEEVEGVHYIRSIIILYLPGRISTGTASLECFGRRYPSNELVGLAIRDAIDKIIIDEKPKVKLEDFVQDSEFEKAVDKAVESDNKKPTKFSKELVDRVNKIKEIHKIDTDAKFDYYVKTWSIFQSQENKIKNSQGIRWVSFYGPENVKTKKDLVSSHISAMEDFVAWMELSTPAHLHKEEDIVSPI